MDDIKEWVKVNRPVKGPAIVTVTLLEGNATAKCSVKAYGLKDSIKNAVKEARTLALADLKELHEALAELDAA